MVVAPSGFSWQAHHLDHLSLVSEAALGASQYAALGAPPERSAEAWQQFESLWRRLILRGRRSTGSVSLSFCVAGAALGASQSHFAGQAQHLEHLSLILRGRRSTWSTSRKVSGSLATNCIVPAPRRFAWHLQRGQRKPGDNLNRFGTVVLRGRCSTWSTSVSFCVAGAALGASQSHFAWQAQHLKHLQRGQVSRTAQR